MAYSETGENRAHNEASVGVTPGSEGTVRKAKQRDLPRILQRLESAYQQSQISKLGATFSSADVLETVTSFLNDPNSVVFVSANGLCAGHIAPSEFSKERLTAHLSVWIVDQGGDDLREAFEDWARSRGAQAVHLEFWEPTRADAFSRLMEPLGYSPISFCYSKDLSS